MKNLFKKSVAIFVTVLMFACMLFTSVACDKDDGNKDDCNAQYVPCPNCNGSGKAYVFYQKEGMYIPKLETCGTCGGKGYIVK